MEQTENQIKDKLDRNQFPYCEKLIDAINEHFISDGWVTLQSERIFSALIEDERVDRELKSTDWCVNANNARPSLLCDTDDCADGFEFFPKKGISLIVVHQNESCHYQKETRLVDEFVLFYDLRKVTRVDGSIQYYKIGESGEHYLVAKYEDECFSVQEDYIKEYISLKKVNLIIQFDDVIYIDNASNPVSRIPIFTTYSTDSVMYYSLLPPDGYTKKPCAVVRAKNVLRHDNKYIKKLWRENDFRKETFIVGEDSNGNEILSTCDENKLQNLFNWDGRTPYQLTLVFFKEEVLDRYYSDAKIFQVQDGYISGQTWSVHADTDRKDGYVVMTLKDLGSLPYAEQQHWRNYNIKPTPSMHLSATTWSRWFAGLPCNANNAPHMIFKELYNRLNRIWNEKFGWNLFLELAENDQYNFEELHMMTDLNNQSEFDKIIKSLTLLMVDSINEAELKKEIAAGGAPSGNIPGIKKVQMFFQLKNINCDTFIELLQKLQTLRSTTVAHRKSREPDSQLLEWFGLDKYPQIDVIEIIFNKLNKEIDQLIKCIESLPDNQQTDQDSHNEA